MFVRLFLLFEDNICFYNPTHHPTNNPTTIQELTELGFSNPAKSYFPDEIFSDEVAMSLKGFLILILSGVCIGFGTRYAGGCTSGHAITGLSNFEIPSLLAIKEKGLTTAPSTLISSKFRLSMNFILSAWPSLNIISSRDSKVVESTVLSSLNLRTSKDDPGGMNLALASCINSKALI